jgi:hypothetical protein
MYSGRSLPDIGVKKKKEKINLSLCLTNQALCHEDVWESGCIDPRILDFGTSWSRVSASRRGHFNPHTHSIGGWVGPRTGYVGVHY